MDSSGTGASSLANVWVAYVQFNTTQTTAELTASNSLDGVAHTVSGDYQVLEWTLLPRSSTTCDILYYIDGVNVYKHTDVTMTSPAVMAACLAIKDGSSSYIETMLADYVYCYQTR